MQTSLKDYKKEIPSTPYMVLNNYVNLLIAMLKDRATEQTQKPFPIFKPSYNDGWRTDGY
jgi:hypothetical protein